MNNIFGRFHALRGQNAQSTKIFALLIFLVGSKSQSKPTEMASGDDRRAQNIRNKARRFRVLIIGRAHGGKTTILQRVCNTVEKPEIFDRNGKKVGIALLMVRKLYNTNELLMVRLTARWSHQLCGYDTAGFFYCL